MQFAHAQAHPLTCERGPEQAHCTNKRTAHTLLRLRTRSLIWHVQFAYALKQIFSQNFAGSIG